MQEMGGLSAGLQMTPGGSRALFDPPGGSRASSGELLGSSSRGLYCEASGSSRRLEGASGSSRALLLTPLRESRLGTIQTPTVLFSFSVFDACAFIYSNFLIKHFEIALIVMMEWKEP